MAIKPKVTSKDVKSGEQKKKRFDPDVIHYDGEKVSLSDLKRSSVLRNLGKGQISDSFSLY